MAGREGSLLEARSGCRWCGARQCNVWLMASRVNIALPSRPLSPAFSVEQCPSGVSLADFFDVERNPATILSRCLAELWEQCLFWPECGEQWIFWEASIWYFRHQRGVWVTWRLSGSASGSAVLPVTKSAGIVEGAGTTKALQTGPRHSLDDPDHDAMSDLYKMWVE